MADHTHIEWTDATWNPITGCSVVSAGCKHCYAMRLAGTRLQHHTSREGLTVETKAGPVWNGQVRFNEQWLDQPLRWRRPRRIFVCAHGDLFHENVPDQWIDRVFAVMASAPFHTFQVLTKRPERALAYLRGIEEAGPSARRHYVDVVMAESRAARQALNPPMSEPRDPTPELRALYDRAQANEGLNAGRRGFGIYGERHWQAWPLQNVWLGVSVEDQAAADERIPLLLRTPAAVRWVSAEPLLGPVDLRWFLRKNVWENGVPVRGADYGHGTMLDWVVAGGESGPGARPMHPNWARGLRDQCKAAGVPFLFKQWGSHGPARIQRAEGHLNRTGGSYHYEADPTGAGEVRNLGKKAAGRLLDGVLHDEYPETAR